MANISCRSSWGFGGDFRSDALDEDSARYEVLKALIEAAVLEQMQYAGEPEKPGPGDRPE